MRLKDLNITEFEREFRYIKTVVDLHEFHVWALSESEKAVTVHLETTGADDAMVYAQALDVCKNYGIHFYTVQLETKATICPLASRH